MLYQYFITDSLERKHLYHTTTTSRKSRLHILQNDGLRWDKLHLLLAARLLHNAYSHWCSVIFFVFVIRIRRHIVEFVKHTNGGTPPGKRGDFKKRIQAQPF